MKDYKFLTDGEHRVKMKEEHSKGIDPCEEGMECMQDKEIRKKAKAIEELNWKHEDVIPEADGPTITPDRNWNPGRPQNQEQEKEREETKELHEQMKQIQPLEAQSKPYDPEEALRQRPNKTGQNPMDIVRTVRLLRGTEDQEIPAWQVAQQQRVKRCMENQAEKDETRTWQEKQQHKIKKCMEAQTWQEPQRQKIRKCMEAEDWQSTQKQKSRKCMEGQLETEEKLETLRPPQYLSEIRKALQIQQVNPTQAEVTEAPAKDNKEKVAIDTYETVPEANPTEDSNAARPEMENLITQEPEKVMRILNNPMRDKEDIDESDENMYFRFQRAIDIEIAEQDFDPQQTIEEDTNEREQLGKEIAE